MLRNEVVFEHVEEQFVLLEDFEAVVVLLCFSLFAHFSDVAHGFAVDDAGSILFGGGGGNDEEVVESVAALDDPIEVLSRDLLAIEIEEDSDRPIVILILLHLEGRKNLALVDQLMVLILVVEL